MGNVIVEGSMTPTQNLTHAYIDDGLNYSSGNFWSLGDLTANEPNTFTQPEFSDELYMADKWETPQGMKLRMGTALVTLSVGLYEHDGVQSVFDLLSR